MNEQLIAMLAVKQADPGISPYDMETAVARTLREFEELKRDGRVGRRLRELEREMYP